MFFWFKPSSITRVQHNHVFKFVLKSLRVLTLACYISGLINKIDFTWLDFTCLASYKRYTISLGVLTFSAALEYIGIPSSYFPVKIPLARGDQIMVPIPATKCYTPSVSVQHEIITGTNWKVRRLYETIVIRASENRISRTVFNKSCQNDTYTPLVQCEIETCLWIVM